MAALKEALQASDNTVTIWLKRFEDATGVPLERGARDARLVNEFVLGTVMRARLACEGRQHEAQQAILQDIKEHHATVALPKPPLTREELFEKWQNQKVHTLKVSELLQEARAALATAETQLCTERIERFKVEGQLRELRETVRQAEAAEAEKSRLRRTLDAFKGQ